MALALYPIAVKSFDSQATSQDFIAFWQSVPLPNTRCYGVYFNYRNNGAEYDFAIATETANENTPIMIDENFAWMEKFSTKCELLGETWQHILAKSKQGLLKRALTVDVEKYHKDGSVDVYISVAPHC